MSGYHPYLRTSSWRDRQCQGYRSDCLLSRIGCGSCPLYPLSFRSRQFFDRCLDSKTLIEILRLSAVHRICWGTDLRILLESVGVRSLLTYRSCSYHPGTWIAWRDSWSVARMGFHCCHRTTSKGCSGWWRFNWSVYWYTGHQKVGNLDPVQRLLEVDWYCSSSPFFLRWLVECIFVALLVEYWV